MIYFRSDYSQGAHPKILEALTKTNFEHTDGYGLDVHCENAAKMIKDMIGIDDCSVHMMVGGTQCNMTAISAVLKPYECAVAPRTGHLYVHETGALEAGGHRIITMYGQDGKLMPEDIDVAWKEYEDEHTLIPRLAYISFPTESGTLYTKAELEELSNKCKANNMLLYVDGARLSSALTSEACDVTIRDLAQLCDAFYIGGTKNGLLFGEALVIKDKGMDDHFRWMIKQKGGMLAKGRLIGVQFEALLEGGEDSIFFKMGMHANDMAKKLREGLENLDVELYGTSKTNQVFPILPVRIVEELEKDFFFYRWTPENDGLVVVRFVTGWGTEDEEVEELLLNISKLKAQMGD